MARAFLPCAIPWRARKQPTTVPPLITLYAVIILLYSFGAGENRQSDHAPGTERHLNLLHDPLDQGSFLSDST